ncbi:MAG: MoxR family ATPase [Campylobacterota bacterium]|nr:MoxR family ATPase [Campylobacterota bacterium]
MKASQLTNTLRALIDEKIPTFVWGAPGIGKSSIVKQISEDLEIGFIDLRLSLMDPTDLKGIPFYDSDEHRALWAPPAFLPREGSGILFLDELNSAPPSVQASAYQLILDRKVGEYELPKGWAIVAAGNREGDRGIVYKMSAPLANRFVHLEMDIHVNDWRDWAFAKGIDERIIAYISYKHEELFSFDPLLNEKSFATPRSWEFVHKVLCSNLSAELLLETISGAIGRERAVDFLSFISVAKELPSIERILKEGEAEYTDDVEVLYALTSGLVSSYMRNESGEALENLLGYSLNMQSEFAVLMVQDLQRSGVNMEQSENFTAWVTKFAYLLE